MTSFFIHVIKESKFFTVEVLEFDLR